MSGKKKLAILGVLLAILAALALIYVFLVAKPPADQVQPGNTSSNVSQGSDNRNNENDSGSSQNNNGISPANGNNNTGQRNLLIENTENIANANANQVSSSDPHDPESSHGGYNEEKAAAMRQEKEERKATADKVQEIARSSSPSNDMDTMDRGQIHRSVADFIDAYCNSRDLASREARLGPMLDLDYIRDDDDGMLYKDHYQYPDRAYGIPDSYTYLYHDDVEIYNAHAGNLTATVPVHFQVVEQLFSERVQGEMTRSEIVVTYKVSLNDNYKIKALKVIS